MEVIDGDRGNNYPKSDEFSRPGYCVFLNAKNVTKNGFKFDEIQFITMEKDKVLRKGKLQRSDVVLTTRGSVGQFALYSEGVPYDNIRINSGMVILRIKSSKINAEYLYAFCKSEFLNTHIENIAFGNAQQQLTVAEIKKLQLFYPHPKEQQKIADCLSSIDELITAEAQKLDVLKAHNKGLMQQLFPAEGETLPKLRFPEFQDTGEWKEKKLKDISLINQGLQIPISERFTEKVENSYFYITNEFLKANSNKAYYIKNPPESVICDENDILMTRTGNTGQVVTNVIGAFHNNFFKIKYSNEIDKDFFVYFLRLENTQRTILQLAGTSTIPDLNHSDFYKMEIKLPSFVEQQKIANCLSSIDGLITAQTQKLDTLKAHKKGLMQQLFPVLGDEERGS